MSETETIFSSKVSFKGVFSFKDFYKFCYDWLTEESGLDVSEGKYAEKIAGDAKEIEVKWSASKKATDYFKFVVKVKFIVIGLKKVEVIQDSVKVKTNEGKVDLGVKADLVRDYQGKFETSAFNKFLRSIYEKWVIPSRITQYEDKLAGICDTFLGQAKAYLDLESKK